MWYVMTKRLMRMSTASEIEKINAAIVGVFDDNFGGKALIAKYGGFRNRG